MNEKVAEIKELYCSIFDSSDWFNAICENSSWNFVEIKNKNETLARLPFLLEKKYGIFTKISSPPLTPYVGPWIKKNSAEKISTKLSFEFDILTKLINELPKADIIELPLHHSFPFIHPFIWKEFTLIPRYTYILNCSKITEDQLWKNYLSKTTRNIIKNSQLQLESVTCEDINSLYNIISSNLIRKNVSNFINISLLKHIYSSLSQKQKCKILFAKDKASSDFNAAVFLVWDEHSIYYLLGGANQEGRKMQSLSFLLWESLKFAIIENKNFDFEGSILKEVESFIRGFGGEPTVYYVARKLSKKAKFFYNLKSLVR
ncbi:hypothetical protein GCL60_13290 [Silvanigrella paludirubra]|uniref:Uncharacterized protein n=1 Tax=Silvanigrella paludirubra TaxID=2499159 RepID=A0A6N6VNP8_9BACT|nr:hypothetical protein [Silvanigrella paludirubra]KAB8036813.1 hypothetical protein GCL60_13290 [Silvanigrella paludirubra]